MPALLARRIEEKEKGSPVDFVKSAAPIISAQQLGIYGKAPAYKRRQAFYRMDDDPGRPTGGVRGWVGKYRAKASSQGVHRIRVGSQRQADSVGE